MLQRSRRTSTNVDLFMSEGFRLNGHNGRTNIRGKMLAAYFGVVRHPRAKIGCRRYRFAGKNASLPVSREARLLPPAVPPEIGGSPKLVKCFGIKIREHQENNVGGPLHAVDVPKTVPIEQIAHSGADVEKIH